MSIKIIGAGFGRTGTESLGDALNLLGFGPVHEMRWLLGKPKERTLWVEKAQGKHVDWPVLFGGYTSCNGWPSSCYWRELIEYYPNSLVILTWRSPESWWDSFERTILKVILDPKMPSPLADAVIAEGTFGGKPDDRNHAIAAFKTHFDEVVSTVSKERLLIHRLGDGWEPLCAHLGVEVPERPYPFGNSAPEFFERLSGRKD